MRGHVPDAVSPFPIGETLPAVYLQDRLVQQICAAADEVLAPVFGTLDALPAYLDPRTTPADMLDWLAGWIGVAFDGHESPARRRELIRAGIDLLPWHGTVRGVRESVRAVFDLAPEIEESGGVVGSAEAGTPAPGTASAVLTVRLRTTEPDAVDARRLDAVVAAAKPAHIPHRVAVVGPGQAENS